MIRRTAAQLRNDRGNMAWALIVILFALALITAFTVAVMGNIKRAGETNSDIAITQRTDAAVADAVARLTAGESLPATRSGATTVCQDVDNRSVCYSYWALPHPGNAADALRYDLITHAWDDSKDRDGQPPADGGHVRAVRFPLEAITYQGTPISENGRIVYQATPAGLFSNAMFAFGDVTLGGPDVKVGSYNSVSALDGTDNGTVASGGWVSYGRAVDVDVTRLYGTDSTGTDRTTRCTGEPCQESDVIAMQHTFAKADEASVQWMRTMACERTVENWIASQNEGRLTDRSLCVNGSFIIDVPTTVTVSDATVVVHGNILIEQSLNAPGNTWDWASPTRLAIYSTGRAVSFDPRQASEPGVGVAALLYAPRAVCSTDPVNHSAAHDPNPDPEATLDYTGAITYSGSLVCDTISIGGSWTHSYDDAVTVSYVDPASASKAWVIGSPDVVDETGWETPVGWEDPTCVPPRPNNAKAWWRLTEPSGALANDSAGNNDLGWLTSERGEGLCVNSKGASFGAGESAASEQPVVSATDGVTLEWWGKGAVGSITSAGVTVVADDTRHLTITAGGTTTRVPFTVENHGKWHFFVVTVTPSGEAKLYVDSALKKTVSVGSPSAGGRTAIGPGTAGSVSELVVYSRVLTEPDIQQRWAAWNASVYFGTSDAGTPFTAPTLSDNGTTYGHLRVRWTPADGTFPENDLTSYVVQRATSAGGTYTDVATIPTPGTAWEDTAPQSGERWYRACAVYNGDRVCGPATLIIAIPQLTAPTVTTSNITTGGARFTWTAVQYAAGYEYQVRTNGGSWSAVAATAADSRTVNRTATAQGTNIELRARGVDAYGQPGPWSTVTSAVLLVGTPGVNGWSHSLPYPDITTQLVRDNGSSAICASGMTVQSRFRNKSTGVSTWNAWSSWTNSTSTTRTYAHRSTMASYVNGVNIQMDVRCRNATTGAVSTASAGHATTVYHNMPSPSGAWAGIIAHRTAGWGASCPAGTSVQYQWAVSAAFGVVEPGGWTTATSWANTGQAWGSGVVYMAARCTAGSRVGGTVNASGGF